MECSDKKPCNRSDCPDCQNDRYRKQYAMRREVEMAYNKMEKVLTSLVADCPTTLSCEDFDHRGNNDLHGAEEDCPPCCRYYKALHEAQEILKPG